MLISYVTHEDYLTQVASFFMRHGAEASIAAHVAQMADALLLLLTLSLDAVRERLLALYCPTNQGNPRDPGAMLRSWLLMTQQREHSPDTWVDRLRREPLLAALAGFAPDDVPGATTHREFLARVADGPYETRKTQDTPLSASVKGRHSRRLTDATEARRQEAGPNHTQSAVLVERLLTEADQPRDPNALRTRLEDLLVELGIRPSLQAGLMQGDDGPLDLILNGDGTVLLTAASPEGARTCDCEPHDSSCDHPREYTSPTAQWCKDAHHSGWRFGDKTYTISIHVDGHDLPLITIMGTGNESDFTLGPAALDDLLTLIETCDLPVVPVMFTGDGHHDCQAMYLYLDQKGLIPIIPLRESSSINTACTNHPLPGKKTAAADLNDADATSNDAAAEPKTADTEPTTTKKTAKKTTKTRPQVKAYPTIQFEPDGTPLCPGKCRMRHHGYNKQKAAHVFNCPAMRPNHKGEWIFHAEDCPFKKNCRPGPKMGLGMYIKSEADLRLFPPISRDSKRFKTLYTERTSVERSNAVEDSYHLDRAHRNAVFGEIRLCFVNICKHARIRWLEATKGRRAQAIAQGLLDWLLHGDLTAPAPV